MPDENEDVTPPADDFPDDEPLGEAGKAALLKEREARREAERLMKETTAGDLVKERKARQKSDEALKAMQSELAELRAKIADADKSDSDRAQDAARRDAEQAALAKANARILAAEVRAAAGKLVDPADAARYLDMSEFEVGDDGSVDSGAISEAISDLIKARPYLAAKAQGFQGTGDGGARTNGSSAKQLTGADLKTMSAADIVKARQEGRLERYLSGQ